MTRFLSVATLAIVVIPLVALAQDPDAAQESESDRSTNPVETITIVGTRTERAISEVAATVSVKTAEDLERELTRDIADLVRFEPGISVGGTGSRFGLGGFNIRGIGGNHVLTLVDGVRVPEEFSFGPYLSARRDFVDLDSPESCRDRAGTNFFPLRQRCAWRCRGFYNQGTARLPG